MHNLTESEITQHHHATTPRGARAVAFSRVVAPLGGAQVHRVEIGEGKHKRSRRENPQLHQLGKAQAHHHGKTVPLDVCRIAEGMFTFFNTQTSSW
jgi:hypothetical protein